MPVTELVFPVYKTDADSLAHLQENKLKIAQNYPKNINGLHAIYQGKIVEENGIIVKQPETRSVFFFEWRDTAAFHNFFPHSPEFQEFAKMISGFIVTKPVPELYEPACETSVTCFTTPVTQIIKTATRAHIKELWGNLKAIIEGQATTAANFYPASGIEKDRGMFLGLISWKSEQEYELVGKSKEVLQAMKELGAGTTVQNIVAQMVTTKGPEL